MSNVSMIESILGITEKEINDFLTKRGKNPKDYDIKPFCDNPFIFNRITKKAYYIDKIKKAIA